MRIVINLLFLLLPDYPDSRAYQDEGDESAHTFTADAIAYGVTRVTNTFDGDDLRAIYSAALSLTVEDELHGRNPYITTLRGGILGPGELRITNEPKPVSSADHSILRYIILICDF